MEEGWVYVLVNSSTPGLVKVGRTARFAAERAAELSAVTGVATPFIVAYDRHFADCQAAERAIHGELDRRGLRVAANREFFSGTASDIIKVVMEADNRVAGAEPQGGSVAARRTAAALLEAGDLALHGTGEAMQDTGEAVRYYKRAAASGSLEAWERLGVIYNEIYAARRDHASRRRALSALKEGARLGNVYCYCGMAVLFALEGHRANFAKAWNIFFTQVSALEEPDQMARFARACVGYVSLCHETRMVPEHAVELRRAGTGLLTALLAELDRVRADPAQRRHVSACLRWAYTGLLPEGEQVHSRRTLRRIWQDWVLPGRAAHV